MFMCEIWLFVWYFPQFCTSDISNCFSGSLRLRDNESRLYLVFTENPAVNHRNVMHFTSSIATSVTSIYTMAVLNLIGRRRRYNVTDVLPLLAELLR